MPRRTPPSSKTAAPSRKAPRRAVRASKQPVVDSAPVAEPFSKPSLEAASQAFADVGMEGAPSLLEQAGGASSGAENRWNQRAALAFLMIVVAVLFGLVLIWHYARAERERNLQEWQVRLGLAADGQLSQVSKWVEDQYAVLSGLAENTSLQLYMTALALASPTAGAHVSGEPAEAGFLRNLLVVTADRGGFRPDVAPTEVPANLRQASSAGIALLDSSYRVLVSSRSMPPIEGNLREFLEKLPKGQRGVLDIFHGPAGDPSMAFAVPVFGVQGDPSDPSQQIGVVVGVRTMGAPFRTLLEKQDIIPGFLTDEMLFMRGKGGLLEYLSPLRDGTPPLTLQLDRKASHLAEAMLLDMPGGFVTEWKDYRGKRVLATARYVAQTGWTAIYKIDAEEALAQAKNRSTRMVFIFLLIIAGVVGGVAAAWRHGASLRFQRLAMEYKELADTLKSEEYLLRLVTDNQPDPMFIVDQDSRYCFANLETALRSGVAVEDLLGKTLESVLGPQRVASYKAINRQALQQQEVQSHLQQETGRYIQSRHIPLTHVPSVISKEERAGVLIVEQDVTDLVTEREKREQMLRHLVDALVTVVDRRNPYASDHSARVGRLSREIALALQMDDLTVDTAETAGKLMNLGKILLPSDLFVKVETLSEKEIKHIYESIYASADFLQRIEFKGPVIETLRQSQEQWNGTGAQGLRGEDILIAARIIAVANAFIGMISPRAYRKGIPEEKALDIMMSEVGTKYDRTVVAAMITYLENERKNGVHWWAV